MQIPKILFLLLLSFTLTKASYELIELGLRIEPPTCETTQVLLQAADVDTQKLITFKGQLEKRLSFLESSRKEAKAGCDKIPEASAKYLSASPVNAKASKKSLLQFHELLHPVTESSSKIEKDVSQQLATSSVELAQLYSDDYHNVELCKLMQVKIGEVVSYLEKIVGEVTPAIEKYMPERKENIQNLESACQKGHTRTGVWSMNYADHEFSTSPDKLRTEDYNIVFEVPFAEPPSVAVAIKSFDMAKGHPGVSFLVTDTNEGSFTIRAFAYPGALINMLEISWLATLSSRSGIYVSTFSVDYKDDIEWSKKYSGTSERTMTIPAYHPVALENPDIIIGLSGFNFEGGADSRVSVEPQNINNKGGELVFKTWWNTTLYTAEVNALHFSKNNAGDKSVTITSVQGGALYNAVGNRKEENKILLENPEQCPLVWMGLKKLDIKSSKNYKFKMDTAVQEIEGKKMIDIQISTWDDCSIWQVIGTLFYMNTLGLSL